MIARSCCSMSSPAGIQPLFSCLPQTSPNSNSFSVDIETNRAMQKIVVEDFKDRTIIVVAHRLETILDFDRVVVLDQGRLVEDGSPSQLLQRNSAFKALYDVYRNERTATMPA